MSTYLKTGMEKVFVDNEKKILSAADGEKIIQKLYYAETEM